MIHHPFAFIDWVILGAYGIIVILIGIVSRSEDDVSDYFFARHRMPWWAVGISLIATSVSASTFLGNPAEAYQFDLRLLQLNLGVPISIAIVCLIFIPYFQKSHAKSAYETLELRFDLKTRTLASVLYTIHVLLRTGILIYGPSLVFATITGLNIYWTIIVVGFITILYTTIGGIRAVIWTDFMQFLILATGGVLILFFIDLDVPGGFTQILSKASSAGKLKLFDLNFDLANPRNIWSAGIAYIALDLAIRACDQQFVQRYLSCKDVLRSQFAAILSAVAGLFIALLFFAVGIFLWGYYQNYPTQLPMGFSVNQVLPNYIATKLPWGMSGLIVAAVLAAAMSSLDSAIQALANVATVDFYQRFKKGKKPSLKFARKISVVWGILGIVIGLLTVGIGKNLFIIALSFTSLFTGALLGIFILAVLIRRANGTGAFYGGIIGVLTLLVVTKILHFNISWPWYPVISMTATIVSGVIISLFSAPPKRKTQELGFRTRSIS